MDHIPEAFVLDDLPEAMVADDAPKPRASNRWTTLGKVTAGSAGTAGVVALLNALAQARSSYRRLEDMDRSAREIVPPQQASPIDPQQINELMDRIRRPYPAPQRTAPQPPLSVR